MTEPVLAAVAEARARLFGDQDVWFVPIRHHSPACAMALRHLLREIKPAAVLIEGPADLDHLLPLLLHPNTRTPVAWLCQTTRDTPPDDADASDTSDAPDESETREEKNRPQTRSSFFPFCDYSPEWIAVREGASLGASVALIDLPWHDKAWLRDESDAADDDARSLMEERHYAHSRYLTGMAEKLGCVDHHELWDRLFELRAPDSLQDWRGFFGDVFSWSAMARLDYEPEVLEAELSLPRERHMAAHIRRWRKEVSGPIVVVTGGFHTPELLASWAHTKPAARAAKRPAADAWLIRYSFDRLDALNGYASGMPSPAYYQRVWEVLESGSTDPFVTVALDMLTGFAQQTRAQDSTDAVSTALVQAAALQVVRLAALRGNDGPGRQDLLDAIRSCFIKGAIDQGTQGFTADLRHFLGGTRIGDIPPSAGSPPLIEDARRRARAAGVRLDDTTPRVLRLDLYRKPAHRERSRYLHAMAYIDAGLGAWLAGPDFLGNSRLNLLFEEWRAAWSPLIEARLIELAVDGPTLESVCMARLRREERALGEQGRARSASAAVMLLLRACLIGLHTRLPQLLQMLAAHLEEDASFSSVVECGHRLVTLWRAREPLGVQQHPQLHALLQRVWPAALFLLPNLAQCDESGEAAGISQLCSLRELESLLRKLDAQTSADVGPFHAQLNRFATAPTTAPGIAGAAGALLFLDGAWSEAELESALGRRFGTGAQSSEAVRFLSGIMSAAPELLVRIPILLSSMDDLVRRWDDETFISYLPDLRKSFTALRPQDTAELATRVCALHGIAEHISLLEMHYETTEQDLHAGMQLQRLFADCLRRDGLSGWVGRRTPYEGVSADTRPATHQDGAATDCR